MNKLIEKKIASTSMIGKNSNDTIRQITRMMDLVYGSKTFSNIDLSFFDVNGSVLLYGIPGVGKTTIVMNCINYALDKYGIEAYTIDTPEVIVSNLGESTQNIYKELDEFASLNEGILFIDEIDRLCVNRNNKDEVSELKRVLIEIMKFMDENTLLSKKMIIACTNVIEQIDTALIRRFSIKKEITNPSSEEKEQFILLCMEKCGLEKKPVKKELLEKYITMDDIKNDFRDAILDCKLEKYIKSIVEG